VRADAQRNRARLLDVAEQVFLQHGTDTSTEDIAKAAGVGVGTVFRHFPTKAALIEAVYHNLLARMAAEAQAAAAEDDPSTGLFRAFTVMTENATAKSTFADALTAMNVEVFTETSYALKGIMADLLNRARDAGAVRPDLQLPELLALLVGTSRALEQLGPDPAARTRVVAVVLNGLAAH
jgi:AcrR family transcriptional regulator